MVYSDLDWQAARQVVYATLAETSYRCTDLQRLNGGFTNFAFRGFLANPAENGVCTVIIKHAKSIVRTEFTLHARRGVSNYF